MKNSVYTMASIAATALTGCGVSVSIDSRSFEYSQICEQKILDRIFFGFNTPSGPIAPTQWAEFVADVITPRFPDGFTILEGDGQWRGAKGKVEREESRIVEIVRSNSDDDAGRIREIASQYKWLFDQEAVLVIETPTRACMY